MSVYQVGTTWYVEWDHYHAKRRVRIRRAIGPRKNAAIAADERLDDLAKDGRWDLLQAVASGELRLEDLLAAVKAGKLAALPNAEALRRVDQVLEGFVAEARSPHTAEGRKHVGRRLLTLKADATLQEVPGLVALLRGRLMGKPRSFNHILMTARALIKGLCGERSALYETIRCLKPLPYTARKVRPFTRGELREIMDWMGPVRGRMLWTMCLTGMRPGEYWGAWEVDGGLIRVHGTKTAGSDRIVPLVEEPARPECSYAAFRQHLAKYPGGRVRPYRARHTFAHWCERARISKTRIRLYLGHSARSVTDDYLWHEVQAFTRRDAERLRALLGDGRVAVRRATA